MLDVQELLLTIDKKKQDKVRPIMSYLTLQSVTQLIASCKNKEFRLDDWVSWINSTKASVYFNRFENLFLKYHSWIALDLVNLTVIEKLVSENNYQELMDWCETIFKTPYAINDTKSIFTEDG